MQQLFDYVIRAMAYMFNASVLWLSVYGTGQWTLASATITAPPVRSSGLICPKAEIVYSYRIDGELYTGIHEEPFFQADSLVDYLERFRAGRSFVVRVKPGNPEVSVVCDGDQGVLLPSEREQLTS